MKEVFDISPGEVHLWWASLDVSDDDFAHMRTCLVAGELERAARFRIQPKGRRFIVARAVLRLLLGRATGVEPAALEFRLGTHGKPYLTHPGPFFNASDSGDHVVVALASDEVGVDIEVVRHLDQHERLARRISTDSEFEALATIPEDRKNSAVLRLWTCKEAALKAVGTGLPGGFRNVQFRDYWTDQPRVTQLLGETGEWAILYPNLVPEILSTVVARGHKNRTVNRQFSINSP